MNLAGGRIDFLAPHKDNKLQNKGDSGRPLVKSNIATPTLISCETLSIPWKLWLVNFMLLC